MQANLSSSPRGHLLVQEALELAEDLSDLGDAAKSFGGVGDRVVLQLQ